MSEHGIDCDPACRCDANVATGRGGDLPPTRLAPMADTPRLGRLRTHKRSPVYTQEIEWHQEPGGIVIGLRVTADGDMVRVSDGSNQLNLPVDRARLLAEALTNVIEAGDTDE